MIEVNYIACCWGDVLRGVQAGENIILEGEEIHRGERLLATGGMVDFKTIGMLATAGVSSLSVIDLRISILSTGDEIVPVETKELPPGCIRDVNGWNLKALLSRYGFEAKYRGIANDDGAEFERRFHEELADCDLLILSGGSSVVVLDHCSEMLASLPETGILVRGLNIV
ncbi:MAG: molybdopterin molybdenumtransferase MoeA, partial [Cloacibacillus porcorum]|nr:molybdopterin molybdenumtransferase MoeA [Cloacibacillus porcorum]